jgi:excisionase family DNA binding protein
MDTGEARRGAVLAVELLTLEEVAQVLAVSRSTVYDLIGAKRLRSVTIGRSRRVPRESLADLLAELDLEAGNVP